MALTAILGQAAGGGLSSMLMIVAMIAIFYFVIMRPQQKKQKELKKQREAMQKGDQVITAGGIHGKIKSLKDTTVMVEVAPNIEIRFDKASVYPAGNAAEKEPINKEN